MRITTQILNETAKRAGLPMISTSMLDYINSNNSENLLLNALNKSSSAAADAIKKNNYEKLDKEADQLLQKAEIFTVEGEGSIFAKARESGDNGNIYNEAEALIKGYNNTVNALRPASTPLNDYYRKMLQEAALENGEALEAIGITIAKDGTAVLDKDKLKAADIDSLEKVFGPSGTFSPKVKVLAAKISDNAEINAKNLTSQYSSAGNLYSTFSSRYDFWG